MISIESHLRNRSCSRILTKRILPSSCITIGYHPQDTAALFSFSDTIGFPVTYSVSAAAAAGLPASQPASQPEIEPPKVRQIMPSADEQNSSLNNRRSSSTTRRRSAGRAARAWRTSTERSTTWRTTQGLAKFGWRATESLEF